MEHKTIQFLKQQAPSASKALWPVSAQSNVSASKTVQLKKKTLLHKPRWLRSTLLARRPRIIRVRALWQDQPSPVAIRLPQIGLALLVGGIVPLLWFLYPWSLLPILGCLSAAVTLMIIQVITITKRVTDIQRTNLFASLPDGAGEREAADPSPRMAVQKTIEKLPTQPLPFFPNTPMPLTPLVRVLDTIDLSTSKVEHFLDIPDTLPGIPAQPPAEEQEVPPAEESGTPSAQQSI